MELERQFREAEPSSALALDLHERISFSREAVEGWQKEMENLKNPPEGSDLRKKLELFREIIKNQDDFLKSLPAETPVVFNFHEPESPEASKPQDQNTQEILKSGLSYWSAEILRVQSELHELDLASQQTSALGETDKVLEIQREIEKRQKIFQSVSSLLRLGTLRLPPQAQSYIAREIEDLKKERTSLEQRKM